MTSIQLTKKTQNLARRLAKKREFPSAVVGAEYRSIKRVDQSRKCDVNLHSLLKYRLNLLGGLFVRVNGNVLGCCAEVNVSNKVLFICPHLTLDRIVFSDAIRPRTMQVIKMCRNCKNTFI